MGVAYYPELNPPIPGFKPELVVGGKRIARAMPLLDAWGNELGVPTLMSYYSETHAESFAHIGEPVPPDMEEISINWSGSDEGLATVRAYLSHLRSLTDTTVTFQDSREREESVPVGGLIADLETLESVLVKGAEHGCRFRLRIDI